MEEDNRTLEMSVPTIVGLVGLFVVGVSLFFPSIEHGEMLRGFEFLAISTLVAFLGIVGGGAASGLVVVSLVAVCVSCFAPLVVVLSTRESEEALWASIVGFVALSVGLLCLVFVPASSITKVYLGYFLWLLGLLVIGVSGVIRSLRKLSNESVLVDESQTSDEGRG